MISFDNITKLFSLALNNQYCIEVEFRIIGLSAFQNCWMGKMPDKSDERKDVYWFGLAEDGSKAYDYTNYEDFSTALVFDGRSLKDVWDRVEILSVDGCEPKSRIETLID